MKKYYLAIFFLLFVTFGAHADNRKKKTSTLPDSIPTGVLAEEVRLADTLFVDSMVVDTLGETVESFRYHINRVAQADTGTWMGKVQHRLDSICNIGIFETTQLGIYVYDLTADCEVYAVNHLQRMRPASCQKVVTAVSALHYLGGNYRLKTQLCVTGEVVDSVLRGDVYVVGCMDPVLAQGDVYQMALALKNEGIDSISGKIYIDTSFKDANDYGWGWCWDDKWGPLRVLTVDGKDKFPDEFLADLNSLEIRVADNQVQEARCPSSAHNLRETTHTIDQVLQRMMKNSNNIYAESLFYHLAAYGNAHGVGRKQAATYIKNLITQLGLKSSRYQIADGSGLSLYNYITPQLLVRMLNYAWTNQKIRTHLYPSLPVAGVDGTLSSRMRGTAAEGNVHAKTGTVEGVSSLSGYATSSEGHILSFSIINQGIIYTNTGRDFQNKVCRILCE